MKVLFSDNGLRALYNFRYDVIRHFIDIGYDVVLTFPLCTYEQEYAERFPNNCRLLPIKWSPNSKNPVGDLIFMSELYGLYRKEKPQIVFHYSIKPNIYGTFASHICGIPSVAMVAGLGYAFEGTSLSKKMLKHFYKIALRRANWVITLNSENYQFLQAKGYISNNNSELFEGGEGVNLQYYKGRERSFDRVNFILMSRILFDKGYDEYSKAAKIIKTKYPDVNFFILGPTDYDSPMGVPKERFERDIKEGFISYLGYSHNIKKYLDCDNMVSVLPSYHEGLSRTLMESIALGLPIITSNISGCRETVCEGENGFLVKTKDFNDLANAMERFILLDKKTKSKMSASSLDIAKRKFDVNQIISRYDNIISKICKEK